MERTLATERAPSDDGSVEGSRRCLPLVNHPANQFVHTRMRLDRNIEMNPAGKIGFDERQVRLAVAIDIHLEATARPNFTRIAALDISRIDNRGRIRRQDRTRM